MISATHVNSIHLRTLLNGWQIGKVVIRKSGMGGVEVQGFISG